VHLETLKLWFNYLMDVHGLIQTGGYVALAVIVFIETGLMVGFFLPGDSLLVTAGLFAAKGDLNIVVLNLLLMACAVAGDATGYYIGRKLGPALFRRDDSLFFKKQHLIAAHDFYEKHGGKTIIIARFVPVIRTFAPVVAGIGQMSYGHFAAYNVVGGVGWVFTMTMIGYSLIKIFPGIEKHINIVIIVVIVLSILPGIIEFLRAKMKARNA
jgi:membrane-associated protein